MSVCHNAGKSSIVAVGDCRDEIPLLQKMNLIFLDPPFNWGRDYDVHNDRMLRKDYLSFLSTVFDLSVSKLMPTGTLWLNIGEDMVSWCELELRRLGMHLRRHVIWHYRFGQNTDHNFISSKSHVLYMTRHKTKFTWNQSLIREQSDRRSKYKDKRTELKTVGAGLRSPLDVWYGDGLCRIQGNNKERMPLHDNQLPEAYLFRVLRSTANSGDNVLDPFLGSGTTGVVADHLGMNFRGIEISSDYAVSAAGRITKGPVNVSPILH